MTKTIEELDFTPSNFLTEYPDGRFGRVPVISDDECAFLGSPWKNMNTFAFRHTPEYEYFWKLHRYYERFGAHMPPEVRRELLREIKV